ncbi:hypothetical protein HDV05_006374 [Chytridiales sp. JEL 0842]|nr:hypothetical protein HDV05_006374 [Chytridiales sp. JEL 0842]
MALHSAKPNPQQGRLAYPLSDDEAEYWSTMLDNTFSAGAPNSKHDVFIPTSSSTSTDPSLNPMGAPHIENEDEESLPPEYQKSRRGKPCGHVFRVGEALYWCRNCALDDTCVFCYRCFHATDHEGHDTSFSISQRSGGCCDCGDPEAWRIPLKCKYHSVDEEGDHPMETSEEVKEVVVLPVPESLVQSMRSTIATALDFILDTLSGSPTDFTVPQSVATVKRANPPETDEEKASLAEKTEKPSGSTESGGMLYALLLWNDEEHSFGEVIERVMGATNHNRQAANDIAVKVDAVGRDVIMTSTSVSRLVAAARSINGRSSTGLTVTIRSARETYRESLSHYLVEWLKGLVRRARGQRKGDNGVVYEAISTTVRQIICEELCKERRNVKEAILGYSGDVEKFMSSLSQDSLMEVDTDDFHRLARSVSKRLRVDYLLGFDARLWKDLRGSLRELYISTVIVHGDDFKKTMGIRYAYTYLMLANSFLYLDREWEGSIINFSVQLFTVPTIASQLFSTTTILSNLMNILKALLLSETAPSQFSAEPFFAMYKRAANTIRPRYPRLPCEMEKIYKRHRYTHIFHDIRYILGTTHIRQSLFRQSDFSDFIRFLDLCKVMQGMYAQKRQVRTHVEYENPGWMNSFYLSSSLSRVIEHFTEAFAPAVRSRNAIDFQSLIRAIRLTLKVVDEWCAHEQAAEIAQLDEAINNASQEAARAGIPFQIPPRSPDGFRDTMYAPDTRFRVLDYRVLRRPVTLHHPLHWVLSALLSFLPQYLMDPATGVGSAENVLASIFSLDNIENLPPMRPLGASIIPDIPESQALDGVQLVPLPDELSEALTTLNNQDRISRILDHSLRTEVLLAQIRAGLWVRNGQVMRQQALYFKYHFLRDLYEHNLFLIQSCSIVLGSDLFLTIVLDRFELIAWFAGRVAETSRILMVDPTALVDIAEDMLNFIIVIITERIKATNLSVEAQIRREIVQALAPVAGLPHSKLSESIPSRLTRLSTMTPSGDESASTPSKGLDEILPEVALFKFPEGSEKGLHELREDVWDEVDPWFWHYSRTQREAVEAKLLKLSEKKIGVTLAESSENLIKIAASGEWDHELNTNRLRELLRKVTPVRLPTLLDVPSNTGYSGLDSLVGGRVFNQILFFGLYNLTKPENPVRSDNILAAIVHLLLVAVEIEARDVERNGRPDENDMVGKRFSENVGALFIEFKEERGVFASSLLNFVFNILDKGAEEFKDVRGKLILFLIRLAQIAGPTTKKHIDDWRQRRLEEFAQLEAKRMADAAASAEAEREKRKAAAKARQANIMAQFAKQQQSFLEMFGAEADMADDDEETTEQYATPDAEFHEGEGASAVPEERQWNYPMGNCIVCQEALTKDGPMFGMLTYIQSCHMTRSRFVDFRDPESLISVLKTPLSLDVEVDRSQTFSPTPNPSLPNSMPPAMPLLAQPFGVYASGCGHLMHFSCFDIYKTSIERRQGSEHRAHPENLDRHEFMCPLCKSLGNCVFPILWSSKKEVVNWSGSETLGGDSIVPVGKGGSVDMSQGLGDWWDVKAKNVVLKLVEDLASNASSADSSTDPESTGADVVMDTGLPSSSQPQSAPSGLLSTGVFNRLLAALTPDFLNAGRRPSQSIDVENPVPYLGPEGSPGSEMRDVIMRVIYSLNNFYMNDNVNELLQHLRFAYAYTVSSIERMVRGVGNKLSSPAVLEGGLLRVDVLETVKGQNLSFLRVFSELILTLSTVIGETKSGKKDMLEDAQKSVAQLFIGVLKGQTTVDFAAKLEETPATLYLDPFGLLVELTMLNVPMKDLLAEDDVFSWISICWMLEVVRSLLAILESIAVYGDAWFKDPRVAEAVKETFKASSRSPATAQKSEDGDIQMSDAESFSTSEADNSRELSQVKAFIQQALQHLGFGNDMIESVLKVIDPAVVVALLKPLSLPFLRNVAIYIYSRFGIVPPTGSAGFGYVQQNGSTNVDEKTEFDRLLAYLRLPSITSVMSLSSSSQFKASMVAGWIESIRPLFTVNSVPDSLKDTRLALAPAPPRLPWLLNKDQNKKDVYDFQRVFLLNMPSVFELVPLPHRLETLFEECFRKTCPNCNKTIIDPALCLICGNLVCAMSYCCKKDRKGECNLHNME